MSQAETTPTTSRRSVLAVAASLAAGTVAGSGAILSTPKLLATPATTGLDGSKGSPALKAAVIALSESHDRLVAAKARFAADDLKMVQWGIDNPAPTGKRALRKHRNKFWRVREATVRESWDAQLAAEKNYRECQIAAAKVRPRDEHDLGLKAAVAAIYDEVRMASFLSEDRVISYSVAWDMVAMRGGMA